jgi:hypothetical protein
VGFQGDYIDRRRLGLVDNGDTRLLFHGHPRLDVEAVVREALGDLGQVRPGLPAELLVQCLGLAEQIVGPLPQAGPCRRVVRRQDRPDDTEQGVTSGDRTCTSWTPTPARRAMPRASGRACSPNVEPSNGTNTDRYMVAPSAGSLLVSSRCGAAEESGRHSTGGYPTSDRQRRPGRLTHLSPTLTYLLLSSRIKHLARPLDGLHCAGAHTGLCNAIRQLGRFALQSGGVSS